MVILGLTCLIGGSWSFLRVGIKVMSKGFNL
jgi:hypothetical protein